jgi:hypothetical protein
MALGLPYSRTSDTINLDASFLGHPGAKFFDENGDRPQGKKKEDEPEHKKGDILNEVTKGTFRPY